MTEPMHEFALAWEIHEHRNDKNYQLMNRSCQPIAFGSYDAIVAASRLLLGEDDLSKMSAYANLSDGCISFYPMDRPAALSLENRKVRHG